jgi:amidohydrolase
MRSTFLAVAATAGLTLASVAAAQTPPALLAEVDARAAALESRTIEWRRDLHANPELGNFEARTARKVAEHLRRLGLEVRTGVAGTGVVGVLRGGRPGPVVALRADMDALPVREETGLPFASKATGTYRGATVPVMHACGHDAHTAMLMTVAEVLAGVRERLPGTVVFLFQPAEEGPADFEPGDGRAWGAKRMVEEGALDAPKVDAVFGLHVFSNLESGKLGWRAGPLMASADSFTIVVNGRQTHGAMPWAGVDPIVVGAQIVGALQTIVSRQLEIVREPAVVSIGQFHGGVRFNIIPQTVTMEGTVRAYDTSMREDVHRRIRTIAEGIAASAGATVDVRVTRFYDVTANSPELVARMGPTLRRVAGDGPWSDNVTRSTAAEDFSEFARRAPAMFFFLGVTPKAEVGTAPANHSPLFTIDEGALRQGVRGLAHLAVDYLHGAGAAP